MHIIYNNLDIKLAVPVVIAFIGFVKWIISHRDIKKNVPKTPNDQA